MSLEMSMGGWIASNKLDSLVFKVNFSTSDQS